MVSGSAKADDDDLVAIEADASELRRSHLGREHVIRTLGGFFQGLAAVPLLFGAFCVVEMFRTKKSALVTQFEQRTHAVLPGSGDNEVLELLVLVGLPVLFAVVSAWLFFRLGRNLRRHSPLARWCAALLLATACIPPLTLFFQAVWGHAYWTVAAMVVTLAIPASLVLFLTASASDVLFSPQYRALVRARPLRNENVNPYVRILGKLALVLLGLIVVLMLAMLAL